MISATNHRFRLAKENKFGQIPTPNRVYINARNEEIKPVDTPVEQATTPPVWEVLGITENEYFENIHVQPVPENAHALELQLDSNEN
jgi:hypothetical protein